jgi:PPK2 family polyphosphate:nucleotide phosphotransferase
MTVPAFLETPMKYRKKFLVTPGKRPCLAELDPAFKGHHENKQAAQEETEQVRRKLAALHTLLYAEKRHSVLVVLQAPDAGGKDGTVSHVFTALNPAGTTVTGFKEPTPVELEHDFLWRVHPHAPRRGYVAIFNRSHYEDVLITRVHKLIDKATWTTRYERIRAFEAQLIDSGTHIVKFFLHISKEEQLARFARRLDDPARHWKISEADYSERALWDDYTEAFEDALEATSTHQAPWYVIPANHKWFRNLAVSRIVADTMEDMGMSFPKATVDLADIRRKFHAEDQEAHADKKAHPTHTGSKSG